MSTGVYIGLNNNNLRWRALSARSLRALRSLPRFPRHLKLLLFSPIYTPVDIYIQYWMHIGCNIMQYYATLCSIMQHYATLCNIGCMASYSYCYLSIEVAYVASIYLSI